MRLRKSAWQMLKLALTDEGQRDYEWWLAKGRPDVTKRIDRLLEDACEHPHCGLGKPEPLVGSLSGFWSRRITSRDRLIYKVDDGAVVVVQCKGHYSDG